MSYSKDHSRKNPLAPSRMYGLSSSASTSTTPIDNEPIVTTERTTRGGVEGTLTTKEVKPRQSKLPKVGMEEAYDRALKLGYRDENETLKEFTIRANKFNEGSTEESFVEDEKKQEKPPLKPIKSRPIKSIDIPETVTPIQSVPFVNPVVEEDKVKKKRSFDINLPKINLPNIDINLPTFSRNRSPKAKILKKGGKGFMSGKKSGRLKTKRKFSGRRR
jgi:hypothetical protein